jgi:hypothetical protein
MNKKYKKHDWIELKNEYLTTSISLRGLAQKYKIPYSTVNSRSNKEKWTQEKFEVQSRIVSEVEQKVINGEIDRKVLINQRHIQLYNMGMAVVETLLDNYENAMKDPKRRKKVNPLHLEKLLSCAERIQRGQRLALNMEKEDTTNTEPDIFVVEGLEWKKI